MTWRKFHCLQIWLLPCVPESQTRGEEAAWNERVWNAFFCTQVRILEVRFCRPLSSILDYHMFSSANRGHFFRRWHKHEFKNRLRQPLVCLDIFFFPARIIKAVQRFTQVVWTDGCSSECKFLSNGFQTASKRNSVRKRKADKARFCVKVISRSSLRPYPFEKCSLAVHPFDLIRSKKFISLSSVRPHPFENFA